jgi:ribosomal protein S18 acetylase RimI-like enzyme
MSDLLVKLYNLPPQDELRARLHIEGIEIRRAHPADKGTIVSWVRARFEKRWADECQGALEQRPATCFIAVEHQKLAEPAGAPYVQGAEKLIGIACYDIVARGMFGPEGVDEAYRGRTIGKALLLAALHEMHALGYAYAVIAWAGPIDFYARTVGATVIEGSEPGPFHGPLTGE